MISFDVVDFSEHCSKEVISSLDAQCRFTTYLRYKSVSLGFLEIQVKPTWCESLLRHLYFSKFAFYSM